MKCPYCFRVNRLRTQRKKGSRIVYYCSYCHTEVPKLYVESPDIPITKIGMVGYPNHGKTVFSHAMLFIIKSMRAFWNDFYFETLDDGSHESMFYDVKELIQGRFPASTRAVYPLPDFMRLNNMPYFNTRFISLFDTGGQLFNNLELMTRKGRFFTQSNVIFFFISLTEEEMKDNWNLMIMKLLDRYIHVVYSRYGIKTAKQQSIVFILSKADELLKLEGERKLSNEIVDYYNNGNLAQYQEIDGDTFRKIIHNSKNIEAWLRDNNCNGFINYSRSHFKNINFVLTSSFGDSLVENHLEKKLKPEDPKCVLDPLIWALNQ